MEIRYTAPDHVQDIIRSLDRTEDVRFSPNNRRLAIAGFNRSTIVVFDVEIANAGGRPQVSLTSGARITSACLNYPHGLEFLDDETLVVANRQGDVVVFRLPSAQGGDVDLMPIQILRSAFGSLVFTPGSVSALRTSGWLSELLVCNNYGDSVSRHVLDRRVDCAIVESDILLEKWLNLPDGVSASHDGRWIAVSNHNTNSVLLYDRSDSLNAESSPVGVLRGAAYPHGLRFSADGRYLLLADAGAPFVHVYRHGDNGWYGAWTPAASIRVMDDQVFRLGRRNPQEGGPKGIDFDRSMAVLAVTSEYQPLQFLDATSMIAAASRPSPSVEVEYELGILETTAQFRANVRQVEERAAAAEARAAAAEARVAQAEAKAVQAKTRAKRFKAKAAKAKAKAARAKARAAWVMAPLSRVYFALRRPN